MISNFVYLTIVLAYKWLSDVFRGYRKRLVAPNTLQLWLFSEENQLGNRKLYIWLEITVKHLLKLSSMKNILGNHPSQLLFVQSQKWKLRNDVRVRISRSQFAICKAFWQFTNEILHLFSKNCESRKSDTSWIFRVIHWTSYIGSYFKPNKYPMLNNNVISQRFIVHINFKSHTSFFSIILLRSSKL